MTEPARYVHIVDDVPELDDLEQGPVLIHSLDGFLDAGNAAAIATQALLSQSSGRVVASFEIDAFYDYRARRPPMTFSESRYEDYEPPRLVVRLNHDSLGDAVPPAARPGARHPLGGLRARGPRGRGEVPGAADRRRWAPCRWRSRTPGR